MIIRPSNKRCAVVGDAVADRPKIENRRRRSWLRRYCYGAFCCGECGTHQPCRCDSGSFTKKVTSFDIHSLIPSYFKDSNDATPIAIEELRRPSLWIFAIQVRPLEFSIFPSRILPDIAEQKCSRSKFHKMRARRVTIDGHFAQC
jgi:hypothetical protein